MKVLCHIRHSEYQGYGLPPKPTHRNVVVEAGTDVAPDMGQIRAALDKVIDIPYTLSTARPVGPEEWPGNFRINNEVDRRGVAVADAVQPEDLTETVEQTAETAQETVEPSVSSPIKRRGRPPKVSQDAK